MRFYGKRFGIGYVENRKKPFFTSNKRVLVLDVDGVVIDGRGFNPKFEEETMKFIQDHPEVRRVYWSMNDPFGLRGRTETYIQKAFKEHFPLNRAHLYIAGCDYSTGDPIKDLSILNSNTANVLAVEDDHMFIPRERVIQYQQSNRPRTIFNKIRERLRRT